MANAAGESEVTEPDANETWRLTFATVRSWLELIKIFLQIVAIVVGAWWAYTRFFAAEAPSLEEHGSVESSLEWTPADQNRCTAVFGITMKNNGKRSFDVKGATLRLWLVPQPAPGAGVVPVKPYELMKTKPTFEESIPERSLLGHYAPDAALHDDFVFSIPRDAPGKSQIALFTFDSDTVTADGKPLAVQLDEYRWSGNCEVPLPTPVANSGTTQLIASQSQENRR